MDKLLELLNKNKVKVEGIYVIFDRNSPNIQITENFKLLEFLTKNKKDSYTKINLNIILELQRLRSIFGSGIGINSSYRSLKYNKSIGGASLSEHIEGNALDTYPINGSIKEWKNTVIKNKKTGGIGIYKTFVHIDTGKTRYWEG